MKIRNLVFVFIGVSALAFGQAPVTVKPSPASDALNNAAKDFQAEQKAFDNALQQARFASDLSQKQLVDQLQALNKKIYDQLHQDKHYKPMLDQIDTVQKQLQALQQTSEANFQKEAGPIQAKSQSDKALIDGLIPVVRKENGLPDTQTYDPVTQTWSAKK